MKANYHTHTTFCDGKNSPEEIVRFAIEDGFNAIGFSGHGYTSFDQRYCMKDTCGYISTITALKEKYRDKIQIYLGVEEDAFHPVNRDDFDYIIGSSHYFCIDNQYYPIDSSFDYFKKCLEVFDGDVLRLSETYYDSFCNYILNRKPDIVGHFDLITKFDEIDSMRFLNNPDYLKIAEKYMQVVASCDVIFEINTGAISRGFRSRPYPHENLLHILRKNDGKIMLSSDCHDAKTLAFNFDETKLFLRDIGFDCIYTIYNSRLEKEFL